MRTSGVDVAAPNDGPGDLHHDDGRAGMPIDDDHVDCGGGIPLDDYDFEDAGLGDEPPVQHNKDGPSVYDGEEENAQRPPQYGRTEEHGAASPPSHEEAGPIDAGRAKHRKPEHPGERERNLYRNRKSLAGSAGQWGWCGRALCSSPHEGRTRGSLEFFIHIS